MLFQKLRLMLHRNLQYRERVAFEGKFETAVGEFCSLELSQRSLAIQLFYLCFGWIEGTAHRSILRQDIAVFIVDAFYGYLRIARRIAELEAHAHVSSLCAVLFSQVDKIPYSDH